MDQQTQVIKDLTEQVNLLTDALNGAQAIIDRLRSEGDSEYFIDFTTRPDRTLDAVRIRLGLVHITNTQELLNVALTEHPLYAELQKYVRSNRR